jgi:hypothetical protein
MVSRQDWHIGKPWIELQLCRRPNSAVSGYLPVKVTARPPQTATEEFLIAARAETGQTLTDLQDRKVCGRKVAR